MARALDMGYKKVLFLDSDAFFSDTSVTIPNLIQQYVEPQDLSMGKTVFFSGDLPYRHDRVNTGVILAMAHPGTTSFLRGWWAPPSGRWARNSPFEQEVVNRWYEAGNLNFTQHMARLHIHPVSQELLNPDKPLNLAAFSAPITHITSLLGKHREPRIALHLAARKVQAMLAAGQ